MKFRNDFEAYIFLYFVLFIPFFIGSEILRSLTGSKFSRKKVYGIFTIGYVCFSVIGHINNKIKTKRWEAEDEEKIKKFEEGKSKVAFFRPCNNHAYCVEACKDLQTKSLKYCPWGDCEELNCPTRALCMDSVCAIITNETSRRK